MNSSSNFQTFEDEIMIYILLFFGLVASGKSTLSQKLKESLEKSENQVGFILSYDLLLDGNLK